MLELQREYFSGYTFTLQSSSRAAELININPKINPCFILCNSIKTILLIRYVLDNLYIIHEHSANELFIKRGSCFISIL